MNRFAENLRPFVEAEITLATKARAEGDITGEFTHLENAHVLGQEATVLHVKVHWLMLCWGIRNAKAKEIAGQIIRLLGATTKTAFGLVPIGNTGGANVSPFKSMPLKPEHADIIKAARNNT